MQYGRVRCRLCDFLLNAVEAVGERGQAMVGRVSHLRLAGAHRQRSNAGTRRTLRCSVASWKSSESVVLLGGCSLKVWGPNEEGGD